MLALVLTVPATEVELASDALWALGVLAVEERDGGAPTEDHLVELWTALGNDPQAVAGAAEGFPARWRWRLEEIDETVADQWRAHAQPSWITAGLVVVPAWLEFEPPPGVRCLRIEPADTFGLGDHPTTVLTARGLLDALFDGATVLDVGCGSGVLSVIAATHGAEYVEAVDIHPSAVPTTEANAALNAVEGRIAVSLRPVAEIALDERGGFDVIVANILAPALVELAPELRRLLGPSGTLIVSGILADRCEHVLAALAPLQPIDRHTHDGWAAVVLR